jgi:hypothetical protein
VTLTTGSPTTTTSVRIRARCAADGHRCKP